MTKRKPVPTHQMSIFERGRTRMIVLSAMLAAAGLSVSPRTSGAAIIDTGTRICLTTGPPIDAAKSADAQQDPESTLFPQ